MNVAIPNPWTATLVGVSFQASVDRNGNLYWGVGPTVGKSATIVAGSLVGGWLNRKHVPTQKELCDFLTKSNVGVGGGFYGGLNETWTPGSGTSTEIGAFTPQVGGTYHYTWQKGSLSDKSCGCGGK